jgi:hypothetical protein
MKHYLDHILEFIVVALIGLMLSAGLIVVIAEVRP